MRTIPDLHKLSKDLRQLKHLFEGTKALIQKIRTPRNSDMMASRQQLQVAGDVVLSSTALDRFERLEDRLQLLMLNRIQEYLEEQKALSDTVSFRSAPRPGRTPTNVDRVVFQPYGTEGLGGHGPAE